MTVVRDVSTVSKKHVLAWSQSSAGDKKGGPGDFSGSFWNSTSTALPTFIGASLKGFLGVTVLLYILNQKHMLPKPLSAIVSKALFWPTLPITVGKRLGRWTTVVDDTVVIGGAPFAFAGLPDRLYEDYGIRGVVNLCEEYRGPVGSYSRLGMKQLYLPTVDHFEPSVESLEKAVKFIDRCSKDGKRVYVHCRAGHGRSAAVVFAWLLSKDPDVDRKDLNAQFCMIRDVRSTLWKQPNIIEYHSRLLKGRFDDKND